MAHCDAVVDCDGVELTSDAPAALMASATISPTFLRCTWPGTNWVYEFATATIGFPKSESVIPVARHRDRAPAALRPMVVVRDLNGGMGVFLM